MPLTRLPIEEIDYRKWKDEHFRALTSGDVKFFSDESVQDFAMHLMEYRETTLSGLVNTDTRDAFSEAALFASRRQQAAREEVIKELREEKELHKERAAAQDDDREVLVEIVQIRNDPDLSPDERARELAAARAKRASILADLAEIENRLDERGWLPPVRARQGRAGSAASASTAGTDIADAQRREIKALQSMLNRKELPWKEVLGRALCEQVVNAPVPSSSGVRTWGMPFQRIGHWADFASSMDIDACIGKKLSIDAGAFLTQGTLDASESETGCAMLMYARSGDPLLQHVFRHCDKPFGDVNVSLKFEYSTVVRARPDQLWLVGGGDEMQPLLVHEHKSPAVFPGRDERGEVIGEIWIHALREPPLGGSNVASDRIKHVVEQAYGYMIILGLRYGAISTTELTWFLKRDDQNNPGAQQPAGLLVSSPYECTGDGMESLHIGYLTALLHAMKAGDAARNQFPAPGSPLAEYVVGQWRTKLGDRNQPSMGHVGTPYEQKTFDFLFNVKNTPPAQGGAGGLLPLNRSAMADLLPVPYDKAYERVRESATSSVLRLRRPDGLEFIIKTPVVGGSGGLSAAEAADAVLRETSVYAALFALQGSAVPPLVYGGALMCEEDGGWHAVITLDVGTSLDQLEAPLHKEVQTRALAALACVHAAGCLHGDVALRNFVLCPNTGAVRVIDFARAELVDADSIEAKRGAAAEMAELRECLGLAPAGVSSQSQQQTSSSAHGSA